MEKARQRLLESGVDEHMFRSRYQPLFCPQYVRDAKLDVIDDIGQMIGGIAVSLDEDLVVDLAIFDDDLTSNLVGKTSLTIFGCSESDDVRFSSSDFG